MKALLPSILVRLPGCLPVCGALFFAASADAQTAPPVAAYSAPAAAPPGPVNVTTTYEQFLDVTGGNHNADVVVKTPKSNNPALTSSASRATPAESSIRRSATAELTANYDGASTFTASLDAHGLREDGPRTTAQTANLLASSRATATFTVGDRVPYSLSGKFVSSVNQPTGNSGVEAAVTLVNTDTGVAVFGYDHQISTAGLPFNTSGMLDPGNYQLFGVANFSNVNRQGGSSNGGADSNRIDYTFKVGEATPAPGAVAAAR